LPMNPTVGILTISDRGAVGEYEDRSGPLIHQIVTEKLEAVVEQSDIVPDELDQVVTKLRQWSDEMHLDLILTTGGTGLGPHDVTPEATAAVLERRHPSLLELVRKKCAPKTDRVYLSRGEAGTMGRTLVINFPGSERGATQSLEALLDVLPHAIEMLHGGGH